ncbi:MAG TPA: hypothetical protein VGL91_08295 [Acidobacteriota bacterium]|jgi:hypothetical protein
MKRMLSLSFILLLCLGLGTQAYARKGKGPKGGRMVTLTGCLQSGTEANTYTLTNVTGTAVSTGKQIELMEGAKVSLKEHVGHKVEITGTRISAARAEKMEGVKGPGKKAERAEEKGEMHIRVTSVKHISPTCP